MESNHVLGAGDKKSEQIRVPDTLKEQIEINKWTSKHPGPILKIKCLVIMISWSPNI